MDELLTFLNARAIAQETGSEHETNVRSALDPRDGPRRNRKQMSRDFLAKLMLERTLAQLRITVSANADGYLQTAKTIAGGGGREALAPAVAGNLRDFSSEDLDVRARERMYFLALAMSDADRSIREQLREGYHETEKVFAGVYDDFLAVTHRRIAADTSIEALRQSMGALFEGFATHRRLGADIDDEVVVDAVMRLFAAYTVGPGEGSSTIDRELFGRAAPIDAEHGLADGIVHHTSSSLYDAALDAVESLPSDATISVCSLHGHRGRRHGTRSAGADRLRQAVERHVERGGRLHRVATYLSEERLDEDLDELAALCARAPGAHVETRALVIDAPPVLVPLIAGDAVAFVARDDHGYQGVDGGLELHGPHALKLCALAFEDVWADQRTEWIWTQSGSFAKGIERTRRRLRSGAP